MSSWTAGDLEALANYAEDARKAEGNAAATVQALRAVGCPWSLIGKALGMTKQGAQQRYGRIPVDT